MKYAIGKHHIKVFWKAVHSLARIGEEIYFEAVSNGLYLKTVNLARSAFVAFRFDAPFFDECSTTTGNGSDDEEPYRCKVAMKACVSVFKSVNSVLKRIQRCIITFDETENVVITMEYNNGDDRICSLPSAECEKLWAVIDKEILSIRLVADTKSLIEAFKKISNPNDEVCLRVTNEKFFVKTYVDYSGDSGNRLCTEVTLSAQEFDDFHVPKESEIVFSLKEIRAFLSFADWAVPIVINIGDSGQPVVFELELEGFYNAQIVSATTGPGVGSEPNGRQQNTTAMVPRTTNVAAERGESSSKGGNNERESTLAPENGQQAIDEEDWGNDDLMNELDMEEGLQDNTREPSPVIPLQSAIRTAQDSRNTGEGAGTSAPPAKKMKHNAKNLFAEFSQESFTEPSPDVLAENSDSD